MFHKFSILLALSLVFDRLTQTTAADLIIRYPSLYPENGASFKGTSMMYFGRVYQASVVKYDSEKGTFNEIKIPSITGNSKAHITGIESDRSCELIWAVANAAAAIDSSGRDMSGPSAIVSMDPNDQIVNFVDLTGVLSQVRQLNGGFSVGGTQDITTDHQGNVYIIASYGQAILKFDRKTKKPSVFFASKNPTPATMSYTGIELADTNKLIVWNTEKTRLETFDLTSQNPQPIIPTGGTISTKSPFIGDAVFIPTFSKGSCLLLNNNVPSRVEVFTTKDKWNSVKHAASIDANKYKTSASYTFELNGRIYYGTTFFGDSKPRLRNVFPQVDITEAVIKACQDV
ncbi:hypothetical protein CROQUDRAFT_76893 [Cronartium quercuum f. sp. fusiforme G11]|uniref:Uncharacterized protein n=1 Tax=Cronartium quercuum f. sp. fusiforme G11 TaxID=708437 RepID=A0A9P6NN74_9BASI|nr:hypothetical protein CROQUDRAFT_76893 [Cronartium quercuum f. sp. fusiforme G11]